MLFLQAHLFCGIANKRRIFNCHVAAIVNSTSTSGLILHKRASYNGDCRPDQGTNGTTPVILSEGVSMKGQMTMGAKVRKSSPLSQRQIS